MTEMRTPTLISSFFYHYGLFLSSHPHLFLFLPLLLTSLTLYPMLMSISQLHSQSSIGNIQAFTPSNSIFHSTKAKMASIFPDGGYFSKRDFLSPNLRVVILNVPSKLFEPSFISAYALLRSKLESVKTDKNVTYSTACGISAMSSSSHCGVDPFLLLTTTNLSITYPYAAVSFGSFARIINLGPLFGGARTTKQGVLKDAKYIRMVFDFPPDIDTFQFDEKWMQIIEEFSSETQITSFFWSPFQYEKDMKTIVTTSSKLIPVLFAVLVIFSFCAFWNREDIVSSKSLVAVWGVISAVFGITTSIGLLHLFGIKLLPIAMFTPFLVLSIGIDDAFILLSSWRSVSQGYAVRRREKINQSVEELFAEAVSDAGLSLLCTTISNLAVYSIGCLSGTHAIHLFCLLTNLSLVLVFSFQMSLFLVVLYFDARREFSGRHPLFFTLDTDKFPRRNSHCYSSPYCPSAFVRSPLYLTIIVGTYLLYLAAIVYSYSYKMEFGLELSSLLPSSTRTHAYLQVYERHFSKYSTPMEVVILPELPYWKRSVRHTIINLLNSLENTAFTMKASCWLRDFESFLTGALLPSPDDPSSFSSFLYLFFQHPLYSKYSSDVNSTSGSLAFSRFFLPLRNVNASSRSTAYLSIKSLLHSTSTANSVSLLTYDVSFPLVESSTSINIELMLNFLLIGASSVLSVGVLVPSLFVCLCLLLMLISINLGVFAFLFLCSARVDVVTSLAALLSIGYSIDYTNHLLVHYHSSDLDKALSQMSRPIIYSSISTVLGVLTLLPLQGYITYSFILCVVFVTIFGCLHSLFVVPVFIHFTANFRAYLM